MLRDKYMKAASYKLQAGVYELINLLASSLRLASGTPKLAA